MAKTASNTQQSHTDVKLHYEKAAKDRDWRLRTETFNVAKVNHHMRFSIITSLLRKIGYMRDGIDIGTGTGVWAEVLAEYCDRVVGIDFAEENIKIATLNATDRNFNDRISYVLGDAQDLEGFNSNAFDVATHISVLQHLPDHKEALRRVNDILKDNGYLIILVHNKRCIFNLCHKRQQRQGTAPSINEYDNLQGIVEALSAAGFRIQQVRLCWPFMLDFLFCGLRVLKPLLPVRKMVLAASGVVASVLGLVPWLNPLYREIIILAQKQTVANKKIG